MHVYFVRHGETQGNTRHIHQSPNTPLSKRGCDMVRTLASVLRPINPDLLISSEYTRAIESARIIGLHVGLEPITNGLFYEIVRPSKFYNTSIFSLETLWYALLSMIHKNNKTWQYEDAENAYTVSERAKKARAYIESLSSTHNAIVIVSHTVFINIMVMYVCRNTMLDFFDMIRTFLHIRNTHNAGLIHLEYTNGHNKNTCYWRIIEEQT
jgi:broad specificity phosphatase PhoE